MAPKTNLGGTKFLISAGALAGTVGGWLMLSMASGNAAASNSSGVSDPALENLLQQPLPTLVQQANADGLPKTEPIQGPDVSQPTAQPTIRVIPTAAPPPPPPPVITRSSRR